MLDAITQIELLIGRCPKTEIANDRFAFAAFERFIEILSEASRHILAALKDTESTTPWRDIANIGNYLRHACPTKDFDILWDIYDAGQLGELRESVQRLLPKTRDPR